jgi:hypothetical protein
LKKIITYIYFAVVIVNDDSLKSQQMKRSREKFIPFASELNEFKKMIKENEKVHHGRGANLLAQKPLQRG